MCLGICVFVNLPFLFYLDEGKKDREILHRPRLVPAVSHLGHVMLRTIQAAVVRHRRRFLDKAQLTVLLHREWKQFAKGELLICRTL